ncbi:hypothetical protein B0H11DRAFT_1688310, partial [Mycena galericulata]
PDDGGIPQLSYPVLLKLAIYGSRDKRLTIDGIYSTLIQRFRWFQDNKDNISWK